ncbi:MAG TPA: hypothetical protein ENJ64_00070 [Thiotrichales bacterium]|nr:hypothetical protein [Thiotrichales bacterium]
MDWLNKKTRLKFRLPTEAEWEYAARAGSTTSRPWGDNPDDACTHANVADMSMQSTGISWLIARHKCNDGYAHVAPVGGFKANAFGLYDMMGNVQEWTCSKYSKDYKGNEMACDTTAASSLALRGGAWNTSRMFVRSASRGQYAATGRADGLGFRLARDF